MDDDKYLQELLGNVQNIDDELDNIDPIENEQDQFKNMLDDIVNEAKNDNIPAGKKLTEEELAQIESMEIPSLPDDFDGTIEEIPSKNDTASETVEELEGKNDKKGKKSKNKKSKKEKTPKSKKNQDAQNEKTDGSKKEKKSFKKIITDMLFEDVEDDLDGIKDENQQILEEFAQEQEGNKKGKKKKKEKAPKEKKEKKEKAPKEKKHKEKVPVDPKDKVGFNPVKIIIFVTFVASVIILVLVWTNAFNYYNDMKTAKNYYKQKNYAMAYEVMSGMDIKKSDARFFQEVRQIMFIQKQRDSYYKYSSLNDDIRAFDSLLKAVKVHSQNLENDSKIGVADVTNDIYAEVLEKLLTEYGINENDAIYYATISNYSQYYEILKIYGGSKK